MEKTTLNLPEQSQKFHFEGTNNLTLQDYAKSLGITHDTPSSDLPEMTLLEAKIRVEDIINNTYGCFRYKQALIWLVHQAELARALEMEKALEIGDLEK